MTPNRFRIFILTQEEPFHLPVFFDRLFARTNEVVAVGIGRRHNTSTWKMAKRHYEFFGPIEFVAHSIRMLFFRLMDRLPAQWQRRSTSVQGAARKAGISVVPVIDVNDPAFVTMVRNELRPDLIISVSFSQILKKDMLSLPAQGCINIHSGKLPDYRGMLPTFWAMLNGERSIGVTVQYMAERIDQGDIIVQRMVPLQEGQSLHAVLRECKLAGLEALLEAIDMIRTARVERHPNDPSKGRYFSFPKRDDALKFRQMGWRFR